MEECHKWYNAFGEQIVDELLVECNPSWVYGIIAPSKGYDTRPGDREAVGLGAGEF